jgi:hypothetical protein
MKKVFLGGTCNGSLWRNDLIEKLTIDYFNPVVENWTEECQQQEIYEREHCDYCLYVITPKMTGVYSIAEVVDDSNKRPEKTVFCILTDDADATFSEHNYKSLKAVARLVEQNGANVFATLQEVANFLNNTSETN